MIVHVFSPDGCTNPTASNYNPSALCDDGSCIYPGVCNSGVGANSESFESNSAWPNTPILGIHYYTQGPWTNWEYHAPSSTFGCCTIGYCQSHAVTGNLIPPAWIKVFHGSDHSHMTGPQSVNGSSAFHGNAFLTCQTSIWGTPCNFIRLLIYTLLVLI